MRERKAWSMNEGIGRSATPDEVSVEEEVARMTTLFTPWALRTAVTLRLFDHLAEGPRTPEELSELSGAAPDGVTRLLRCLDGLGFVCRDASGALRLTPRGQVLRADHPSQIAAFLDQTNAWARAGDRAVPGLLHAVRTGGPAWEEEFGAPFWETLGADAELAEAFDRAMSVHASGAGPWVAGARDWSGTRHVVDVGGGSGEIAVCLVGSHAHLRATVLDLPGTVRRAKALARQRGVGDRVTAVGGSFFEPLPAGADAYLLAHILHDWPDAEAVRLLRGCAEAVAPGGSVLVLDRVVPEGVGARVPLPVSQRDLAMLVLLGGRERTEEEFRTLGRRASLRLATTVPAPEEGLHLLEYRPAG
jgi:SAM-dependent methyltransferase